MADKPIELANRFDFQQNVLRSELPVAVKFYGARCQRSKLFAPVFEALAREYAGRVRFVAVDTSGADLLDADYRISHTPTVILFIDGKPVKRWVNEQNGDVYRKEFDQVLTRLWGPVEVSAKTSRR